MSERTPDVPQDPPPPPGREEPPPGPRGGFMALGILLGAAALYALYFGTTNGIAPDEGYRTFAGLLIGLGVFTLLGGGICVAALSQMRV